MNVIVSKKTFYDIFVLKHAVERILVKTMLCLHFQSEIKRNQNGVGISGQISVKGDNSRDVYR